MTHSTREIDFLWLPDGLTGGGMVDLSQHGALERQSSLVYWWPTVEGFGIPVPRTVVLDFGHELLREFLEPRPSVRLRLEAVADAVFGAARSLGYPDRAVFLRTDQASGKHEYEHTCRVRPKGNDEVEARRKLTSHSRTARFGGRAAL